MHEVDLNGPWLATSASIERADFHVASFDDSTWSTVEVPSHWSAHEAVGDTSSGVIYRKSFECESPAGLRSWLRFDGVFAHANVWVDGNYAGEVDSYFAPQSFEVSNALAASGPHVVAVEVNSPSFDVPWPSPGGIWQPVTITRTGAVRIARLKVLCTEATVERAVLSCSAELDASRPTQVQLRTLVTPNGSVSAGLDYEISRALAAGANRISWQVVVEQPRLWWPWALGSQPFHDVAIEVTDAATPHQISDATKLRVGLRQVSYDNGLTYVNGERLFLQSIESGNDGTSPRDTDQAYFADFIGSRRRAGANLLVRSQWIEPAAFYDTADELGMLIWQGPPQSGGAVPEARHARQMMEVLGHHPSIATWLRPFKRLRDLRPIPDAIRRAFDKGDPSRSNIDQPVGWDLKRLDGRDVLEIAPKWTKRSHFMYFTSDPRESASQIDALRLLKYRPLGGFIAPLALPEVIGTACVPVQLIALPRDIDEGDDEIDIDIFVVNDRRARLDDVVVSARVGDFIWSWDGTVTGDSVGFTGTVTVALAGTQAIELQLVMSGEHGVERTYRIEPRATRRLRHHFR